MLTLVHAVVSKPAFKQTVMTTYCRKKENEGKLSFVFMQNRFSTLFSPKNNIYY